MSQAHPYLYYTVAAYGVAALILGGLAIWVVGSYAKIRQKRD